MEAIFRSGKITLRDITAAYEALFFRSVVGFERFCEQLFFEILEGKIRYPATRVACRVSGVPGPIMRRVAFLGSNYLDWLPYSKSIARAKVYFKKGCPFTLLDKPDKDTLEIVVLIRHAIAHSSRHAERMFQKEVIGTRTVTAGERTPGGWLRASMTPQLTRIEVYWAELGGIATKIFDKPRM